MSVRVQVPALPLRAGNRPVVGLLPHVRPDHEIAHHRGVDVLAAEVPRVVGEVRFGYQPARRRAEAAEPELADERFEVVVRSTRRGSAATRSACVRSRRGVASPRSARRLPRCRTSHSSTARAPGSRRCRGRRTSWSRPTSSSTCANVGMPGVSSVRSCSSGSVADSTAGRRIASITLSRSARLASPVAIFFVRRSTASPAIQPTVIDSSGRLWLIEDCRRRFVVQIP